MKITVDTNGLVRTIVRDDPLQASAAFRLLERAEMVAVSNACLCELVWVLQRVYRLKRDQITAAVQALARIATIALDRPACDAGLAAHEAGGDFADGLIAYEGAWLGGEIFVSFDKRAVALVARQGRKAELVENLTAG